MPDHSKGADTEPGRVRHLPRALQDYALLARWDRPIGSWLLLLPCWFGQALATGLPDLWLMACFAVGAFAMRGAGCTVNDIIDRKFDAQVARTRNRPIAAGRISVRAASLFILLQCSVGLLVLGQIGAFAAMIAWLSVPLIIAYPFMKRITHWPQIFLGVTFNWGVLVGFAAESQHLSVAIALLYLGSIAWTVGYDTIYAHQDRADDMLAGVKSSALALGDRSKPVIRCLYAIFWLAALAAGILAKQGILFYPAMLVTAYLLYINVKDLDIDDPEDCKARFRANRNIGLSLVIALILGNAPHPI